MSIASVVTRGYSISGGAQVSVSDVVTGGYTIGTSGLTAADIAAIWNHDIEDGYSAKEILRLHTAILAGLLSKVGNETPEFLSLDSSKVRVKYATDSVGNRIKRLEMDLS